MATILTLVSGTARSVLEMRSFVLTVRLNESCIRRPPHAVSI